MTFQDYADANEANKEEFYSLLSSIKAAIKLGLEPERAKAILRSICFSENGR